MFAFHIKAPLVHCWDKGKRTICMDIELSTPPCTYTRWSFLWSLTWQEWMEVNHSYCSQSTCMSVYRFMSYRDLVVSLCWHLHLFHCNFGKRRVVAGHGPAAVTIGSHWWRSIAPWCRKRQDFTQIHGAQVLGEDVLATCLRPEGESNVHLPLMHSLFGGITSGHGHLPVPVLFPASMIQQWWFCAVVHDMVIVATEYTLPRSPRSPSKSLLPTKPRKVSTLGYGAFVHYNPVV